ncbi:MAG TPA: FGGY family carbohydrate kinase [Saprospiraceae bacterium]|nr:FGGY family carbohydrate kinase [Saprospiraceae bacterium]
MTLIFDIGKTNKKCFIFDEGYQEVYREYVRFAEQTDEDGYPCDDLQSVEKWVKSSLRKLMNDNQYPITAINFSTYGASFVHLDQQGKPLTPLYNYLKPYPEDLQIQFYENYGASDRIARQTASPQLGMLNSGMQLYWLKHRRPEVFEQIQWSLHFPQYLSYLLTGLPVSEFTSIGCHTGLWDFGKQDYHEWVYKENIDQILPPVVSTDTSINTRVNGKKIRVGVGIHDSSGALLPYLKADRKPFLLISTGTWSIALNPFNSTPLTDEELQRDGLHFLRIDGDTTKAARLFLGKEFSTQVKRLQNHFAKPEDTYKNITFNPAVYEQLRAKKEHFFCFELIELERVAPLENKLSDFNSFEEAYHQLMLELVELQVAAVERAMGNTTINKLYIDGGFADNDLYVNMLSQHFTEVKMRTTQSPLGSALGAAIVLSDKKINKKFLKKHYAMKKINANH